MISELEINDMEKAARDWVWENKSEYIYPSFPDIL